MKELGFNQKIRCTKPN